MKAVLSASSFPSSPLSIRRPARIGADRRRGAGSRTLGEISAERPVVSGSQVGTGAAGVEPVRVLLVNSEPGRLAVLAELLQTYGLMPEVAADDAEALERLAAGGIAVLMVDLSGPALSGPALLRCFQDRPERAETAILAYGKDAAVVRMVLRDGHADRCMTVPSRLHELVAAAGGLICERDRALAARGFCITLSAVADQRLVEQGFNVSCLAKAMAMSKRNLQFRMQQYDLPSPVSWLRERRLMHARCLIRGQAVDSVTQAAEAVGMTLSHFSRSYAAFFGAPPNQDMRACRERGPGHSD